jgi:hypothetical protein
MEKVKGVIPITYTDKEINARIGGTRGKDEEYTRHYNQNEDFFVRLPSPVTVPRFPVHHDISRTRPGEEYISNLRSLMGSLLEQVPGFFRGLTYFFDPSEILRPAFYQIFRFGEAEYLYLLRLDLLFRVHEGETLEGETNDMTPVYRTQSLFLDSDVIPLDHVTVEEGKITGFTLKQTVSQTWIGETGRGYFVQGIWMDSELTKFFSKLFLPDGLKSYPYYPFQCKHRTITLFLIDLSSEGRKQYIPSLHRAVEFLAPEMETIQDALRDDIFSQEMPVFQELRKRVPEDLKSFWSGLTVRRYLNDRDMKEYSIEL